MRKLQFSVRSLVGLTMLTCILLAACRICGPSVMDAFTRTFLLSQMDRDMLRRAGSLELTPTEGPLSMPTEVEWEQLQRNRE